jgi:hypothetical protein
MASLDNLMTDFIDMSNPERPWGRRGSWRVDDMDRLSGLVYNTGCMNQIVMAVLLVATSAKTPSRPHV